MISWFTFTACSCDFTGFNELIGNYKHKGHLLLNVTIFTQRNNFVAYTNTYIFAIEKRHKDARK